eukprot:s598_g6.t1
MANLKGIVAAQHVLELKEVLTRPLQTRDDVRWFADHGLENLKEVVLFMQKIHCDNPFLSKMAAKSYAALVAIRQNILADSAIEDIAHVPFSQFNADLKVKPIREKLMEVPFEHLKQKIFEMEVCIGLFEPMMRDNSDGAQLLLNPVMCMLKDMLPHMKGMYKLCED